MISDRRFLVTGGSGFIGSNLVDTLLALGADKVTVLDRWLSADIKGYLTRKDFVFAQGDVRDKELLAQLCKEADVIYHFASILGTAETIQIYDPEEVAEVNILGKLRLLAASRSASVKRVIYPSTPDVPWLNPYKITKVACEKFCQMFFEEYELDTVVLKLPNVYGPRERWMECDWQAPYNYQKIVPTFIMKALKNEPIPIFGDGEQASVYLDVSDAVRAMTKAAESKGCGGKVIPLGTGEKLTVKEIAERIITLTNSGSELKYLPMRPGETKVAIEMGTKAAEELLGFTPKINLQEGLKRAISYYSQFKDL